MIDARHALKLIAIPWARFLESTGEDSGLPHEGDFGRLHTSAQSDAGVTQDLDRLWAEGARGSPHNALWADGALGPEESRAMTDHLRRLKGRSSLLLVEHDMDAVFGLADRITVLVRGRAVASGSPDDIRRNAAVRDAYLGEDE